MTYSNASAPTLPTSRTLAAIAKFVFAAAFALTAGSAFAQQPAAPAPEAQQQAPAPGEQQQQVQLIYSPWTKFCLKGQNNDPNAKQVCFTGKDARIESDRKSTRLNSSHRSLSRMPSSA